MSSRWMNSCVSEMNSGIHSHVFVLFSLRVKCWKNLLFEHKAVEVSHASRKCLHSYNSVKSLKQASYFTENVSLTLMTCLPVQRECLNAFSVINFFYLLACSSFYLFCMSFLVFTSDQMIQWDHWSEVKKEKSFAPTMHHLCWSNRPNNNNYYYYNCNYYNNLHL